MISPSKFWIPTIMPAHAKRIWYYLPNLKYHMERLFPTLVRKSMHMTHNASLASFYLIPHYSTCFYHSCVFSRTSNFTADECKNQTGDYMARVLNYVESTGPYWSMNAGADHVIVFSWDQASEILGWNHPSRRRVSSAIHLTTFGSVEMHPNFNPHKDIVIPPFSNYSRILKRYSDSGTWINGNRSMFAYFRGTFIDDFDYSKGVRQYFKQLGRVYPEKYHIHPFHSTTYWSEMTQTVFALCPSGWSPWSPRLFDSMISGAIPVIFADSTKLPFENVIDYRSFSVKINNSRVGFVDGILKSVANVPEKRAMTLRYRKHIVWDEGGLAFENCIKELERRRSRFKSIGNTEFS